MKIDELRATLKKKHEHLVDTKEPESSGVGSVWLDTGSFTLNKAINYQGKGLPTGIMAEFFGDYSTGKSLMTLHTMKSAQDQGGIVALINSEGAFNDALARKIGLDVDNMLVFAPSVETTDGLLTPVTIEQTFRTIEDVIENVHKQYGRNQLLHIVWDSLSVVPSEKDMEGSDGKKDQGAVAKEIRRRIKRVLGTITNSNTLVIVVSQVYDVISSVPTAESTRAVGGKGIKFGAHVRVEFIAKRGKAGKLYNEEIDSGFPTGVRLHFEIDKNRIGPPFRAGYIDFPFDKDGTPTIDRFSGYLEYLERLGAIDTTTKKGWIVVGDNSYRKKDIEKMLKEHPELLEA